MRYLLGMFLVLVLGGCEPDERSATRWTVAPPAHEKTIRVSVMPKKMVHYFEQPELNCFAKQESFIHWFSDNEFTQKFDIQVGTIRFYVYDDSLVYELFTTDTVLSRIVYEPSKFDESELVLCEQEF